MANIVKNIVSNVKRERFLSVSNILVMSVTFLLFGIFIYVIAISQTTLRYLEEQVQLSVFFKDDVSESTILGLKTKYEKDARVSSVKYVSKEDAFKIFSEINKDEPILLESISPSILPASLEIKAYNLADFTPLSEELSKTDGVEEVKFFRDVIQKFKQISSVIYVVGFVITFVLFLISYSVVISTLRTTITSKGTELEILKVVGASDDYVKRPLIYQGVFYGVFSAFMAGILLVIAGYLLQISKNFPQGFSFGFMPSLHVTPLVFSFFMFGTLLLSGILLGYLGSVSTVKKYLRY